MSKGIGKRLWIEISVRVPAEHSDAVSNFLVSRLGRGVLIEDLQLDEDGRLYDRIRAYLTQEEMDAGLLHEIGQYLSDLRDLHPDFPEIGIETRTILEEDWNESWKRHFRPTRVGENLVIKPSWETYVPKPDETIVEIDPGQAFGTGQHPTTSMMLEAIEALWEREGWPRTGERDRGEGLAASPLGPRVLDVGTGTGILGVVAARMGATSVLGIDVDPNAIEIARENARRNRVHGRMTVNMTPLWQIGETFHLILANLDRDTLILLAKDMVERLEPRGYLLLSGILAEQEGAVLACLGALGLACQEERVDPEGGEWVALLMGRGDRT